MAKVPVRKVQIAGTLRARESVRLGSVDAVQGIQYLVDSFLLTPERGEAVLEHAAVDA